MPLIKDGTVSGVLPETECFAVHYPGYPSSVSRAVETLGGLEGIAKKRISAARRADSRPEYRNESRLELRFRPEDPYCHPAFGDLRSCRGLILRISKKEKRKSEEVNQQQPERYEEEPPPQQRQQQLCSGDARPQQCEQQSCSNTARPQQCEQQSCSDDARTQPCDQQSCSDDARPQQCEQQSCSDYARPQQCDIPRENEDSPDQSVQLSASIVARVRQAYYFDGLADYQFVVPVHAARSRQKKRRRADVVSSFGEGGMDMEQDDLIMLVPKLFSPKDIPEEILLKQSVSKTSTQQQEAFAEHRWEADIAPCLKLSFDVENVPGKVHWEENIPKDSHEWEAQMAVSMLFEERPIWPRSSLLERLNDDGVGVSYNLLRRLLTRSGYYFSTGPFGQFWIKKEYDPRTDPGSRIYQKVEFRLRDLLASIGGRGLDTDRHEIDDFGMSNSKKNNARETEHHELKQRWRDICRFQEFPLKACTLQLFELDDDYIQEKIRETPQQTTCTHSTGWFSRTTFELLCLRVKIRFLSLFPRKGGRSLRSFYDRFEMLKKLEILNSIRGQSVDDSDVNKDTMSQTSKDVRAKNSDVGPMNNGEDFSEHVMDGDLEEDEEEEELDEYESQPMGIDGESFSPRASPYPGDNINISYLQELLCNKIEEVEEAPNAEDQGVEGSDGEYQIYEQDSDATDYGDEDEDA